MNYDYIFWDFDGTIMDTYPGVARSVKYALRHFGMEENDETRLRSMIGPPLRESFPRLYGFDREETEEAVRQYRVCYESDALFCGELYQGVAEACSRFRKAGLRQSITTSKPEKMCRRILGHKGWEPMFDDVFGATEDGRIDTKLQVLNEAFRLLGDPTKSRIVLIGDTKYDVRGAVEAGIDCVGVTYGFGTRGELEEHGAVRVFDTLSEVCAYILE